MIHSEVEDWKNVLNNSTPNENVERLCTLYYDTSFTQECTHVQTHTHTHTHMNSVFIYDTQDCGHMQDSTGCHSS
jgi:hypothetical protein